MTVSRIDRRVPFLGSYVDALTFQETLTRAGEMIRSGRPHVHACVNAAKVVSIRHNAALAKAILRADLVSADGQSIVWAARLFGTNIPERVAGIDLMYSLLAEGNRQSYRVFFLGAAPRVLKDLCRMVSKRFPRLIIVGAQDGYFNANQEMDVVAAIRRSQAQLLFVAMSSPQKELWLDAHREALGVPFAMGVGGSFDVLAGYRRRAPEWLQRSGLEWAFRLLQEPGRMWRRYLVGNATFVWLVAKALVDGRRSSG